MFIAASCLIIASLTSAMSAPAASQVSLPDPADDRGWSQPCHDEWDDGRESHCEIREFPYRPGSDPIAIHGGLNGGITVIGWDRDDARVIYRVKARARTLERANELASQVHLTQSKGWIRPEGPTESRGEWWSVEVKAWVPRSSDLSLQTHNGPVGVRQVRGTMEVRSLNGPVSLIGLSGAVYARAQNGPLHVELTGSSWSGAGLTPRRRTAP